MYSFNKDKLKDISFSNQTEYYMPNGLGGYINATISNNIYRKHNSYLVHSFNAPVDRYVLLTKVIEGVYLNNQFISLDNQERDSDDINNINYLESFSYTDFIPTYSYKINDILITKRMAPVYNKCAMGIEYSIINNTNSDIRLILTPLLANKFLGETQNKEDLECKVEKKEGSYKLKFKRATTYLKYSEGNVINRDNLYYDRIAPRFDIETGDSRLDFSYTPIDIEIVVEKNSSKIVSFTAASEAIRKDASKIIDDYKKRYSLIIKNSQLQDEFAKNLLISTDSFVSNRLSTGKTTILAGLPWFADWGRDTMISFTGTFLVGKRFSEARECLLSFKEYERHGLIPNMFPTDNEDPLYNTVDASLWYFIAAYNYIKYTNDYRFIIDNLYNTLLNIYRSYRDGTDFNIHMDKDSLIIAGSDLDQITWMDVRVGDVVVTPRHGKPVEINALWYNAIKILEELTKYMGLDYSEFTILSEKIKLSFNERFYNEEAKALYDVVDINDASIRPNMLFAVGLPFKLLTMDKAKNVVDTATKELYTRYGMRSLSINDSRFKPKYEGKLWDRDMAYHMGTTWAWPFGIYLDSYLYVNDYSKESLEKGLEMVSQFNIHMHEYCLNGIAEIFDGENPDKSRGCSNQAWSSAEVLRSYYENLLSRGYSVNLNK